MIQLFIKRPAGAEPLCCGVHTPSAALHKPQNCERASQHSASALTCQYTDVVPVTLTIFPRRHQHTQNINVLTQYVILKAQDVKFISVVLVHSLRKKVLETSNELTLGALEQASMKFRLKKKKKSSGLTYEILMANMSKLALWRFFVR